MPSSAAVGDRRQSLRRSTSSSRLSSTAAGPDGAAGGGVADLERVFSNVQWGRPGDTPLVGDFDGDGRSDLRVYRYRAGVGRWYVRSADGEILINGLQRGGVGDIPVVGNFGGGCATDLAVWSRNDGAWSAWRADGSMLFHHRYLGEPGDIPIGVATGVCVEEEVCVPSSSTSGFPICLDVPMERPILGADLDGRSGADLVVYRPATAEWHARTPAGQTLASALPLGLPLLW